MSKWENVRIGDFLYHREGMYKPDNPKVRDLTRLEKIDFGGNIHLAKKKSKTNMIIIKPGDLVISGINVSKGAVAIYQGSENISATIHFSSYKFDEEKIDIDFFKLFLKSSSFIKLLKEQVKAGIKTEIKPKHILPLIIQLPDKKEQTIIVNWFNKKLKKIYKLQDEINYQELLLKHFHQSIIQEVIEGKLTASWRKQNPELINGENSAESLLKKIKEEKGRLIKEKKIPKQKPFPPISEEEKPFELPEGWAWCRLGEIVMLSENLNIHSNFPPDTLINYIDLDCIDNKRYLLKEIKNKKISELSSRARRVLQKGYIAYSLVRPYLNNICIIDEEKENLIGSTGFCVFKPIQLEVKYIFYFLLSSYIFELFSEKIKGFNSPSISMNTFLNTPMPVPSLIEQKKLINHIDMIMENIKDLEKQGQERKKLSSQLTQSLLREAFEQNN